jgi:hypothetical protein
MIHFLHIGKTDGSALKYALRSVALDCNMVLHDHRFSLRDVPWNDAVIFSIRSPLDRFVSGFNSRLRQGQPRIFAPWQFGEQEAFERFSNPNSLAESLWTDDLEAQMAARRAMLVIGHVRTSYADWLWSVPYVQQRKTSVLFILATESLSDDFEHLKRRLVFPSSLHLPKNPIHAHRTPAGFSVQLSERAVRNLECWYAKEIVFYQYLNGLRESIQANPS